MTSQISILYLYNIYQHMHREMFFRHKPKIEINGRSQYFKTEVYPQLRNIFRMDFASHYNFLFLCQNNIEQENWCPFMLI